MPESARAGVFAEAPDEGTVDPFVRLAWDLAAINKGKRDERDETRRDG